MTMRHVLSAVAAVAFVAGTSTPALAAKPADIYKANCAACHALGAKDAKKMGPNFASVGAKYGPKDVAKLAKKIRSGGAGSFGPIPMPPMAMVSEADAKEMAKYALSFKGK
jgi:sulfite dehydrogenase